LKEIANYSLEDHQKWYVPKEKRGENPDSILKEGEHSTCDTSAGDFRSYCKLESSESES